MKVHARRVQYSVRGIPGEVDHALREMAVRRGVSLNQVVVEELTRATVGNAMKADFSDLVGKWTPDPEFDEILRSQRRIDRSEWK